MATEIMEEVKVETAVEEPKKTVKKTTTKKTATKKTEEVETVAKETTKKTAPRKTKKTASKVNYIWGVGRRKKSIARVRIIDGEGKFVVNGVELNKYFNLEILTMVAKQPLTLSNTENKLDVFVNVQGGGFSGQAGAISLGLARAIVKKDENMKKTLKDAGCLTRDARVKERKKYGRKKARKSTQFTKR